jgi:hypothetical protein
MNAAIAPKPPRIEPTIHFCITFTPVKNAFNPNITRMYVINILTSLELVAGVTLAVVVNVACDYLQSFLAKVCDSCCKTQAPELLQRF